uniref:Uncharacterized protein n=1 Tax=Bosea sp. NBC_00436 TaxID=2969620 RepID=A0A9E8CLH1_9HYPH
MKSPDRPQARRKQRRGGFKTWLLREIAKRSPVARLDLVDDARALRLIRRDAVGLVSLKVALTRLRAAGCVTFDETHAHWTGRAPGVKGISNSAYARFRRLAEGDAEAFARLRSEEIARLQADADAALAALRPAGAPPIDPTAFEPWRSRPRLQVTPAMRATLETYLHSPAARAVAAQFREP